MNIQFGAAMPVRTAAPMGTAPTTAPQFSGKKEKKEKPNAFSTEFWIEKMDRSFNSKLFKLRQPAVQALLTDNRALIGLANGLKEVSGMEVTDLNKVAGVGVWYLSDVFAQDLAEPLGLPKDAGLKEIVNARAQKMADGLKAAPDFAEIKADVEAKTGKTLTDAHLKTAADKLVKIYTPGPVARWVGNALAKYMDQPE